MIDNLPAYEDATQLERAREVKKRQKRECQPTIPCKVLIQVLTMLHQLPNSDNHHQRTDSLCRKPSKQNHLLIQLDYSMNHHFLQLRILSVDRYKEGEGWRGGEEINNMREREGRREEKSKGEIHIM